MHDYIIVGGGIAGSILAYRLSEEGKSIILVDNDSPNAAWKVAGGVWNAISFKRLLKGWMADEMTAEAQLFYQELQEELGVSFYEPKEIVRLFSDVYSQNYWYSKSGEPNYSSYLNDEVPEALNDLPLNMPYGAGTVKNGGFVHLSVFMSSLKEHLKEKVVLVNDSLDFSMLNISDNGISYKDHLAKNIVFCEGSEVVNNPFFKWLPLKGTKGEALVIKNPGWSFDFILNNGKHLMDLKDGRLGVGATFEWKELDHKPTEKGKEELLAHLEKNFNYSNWEVLEHKAGIRPTVSDRRPLAGVHPNYRNVFIFNGLGTKGVLIAPWMSKKMVKFLLNDEALPKEGDIQRFVKKHFC